MPFDEERLGEFMGMMGGYMTGGAMCFSVMLGDELGLYRAMAGAGGLSADEVAKRSDCHVRLVRKWLDGQVAGGADRIRARDRHLRAVGGGRDGTRRRRMAGGNDRLRALRSRVEERNEVVAVDMGDPVGARRKRP